MRSPGDRRAPSRSGRRGGAGGLELVLVGANHRTSTLEERERLLRLATYAHLRRAAGPTPPWDDLVLLTTCNRIEAYAATRHPRRAAEAIRTAFGRPGALHLLYELTGTEAVTHLLRVASGLDSLAQGEAQVAAQVRRAPAERPRTSRTSPILETLFDRAADAAARIRHAADLDATDASASHAALRFIEASVHVARPTVALLGTGKMARIAAGSLRGRARIFVANRDPARAREVARALGGRGAGLDALDQILELADVVLAATASRTPVVSATRLRKVLARRGGRPLWLVDLGFPRNIAADCGRLRGVALVDMDGLAPWGAKPLPPAALARAESRIRAEAERLLSLVRPSAEAEIASLRKTAEALRRREVEETLARLPGLTDADRAVVDKLATRLVNRFLHGPTEVLRASPEEVRAELVHELLRGIGGATR